MSRVDVKVHAPTATILMDHPPTGNTLDEPMIAELAQALFDLHQEKRVRAVVLAGTGADFCCGLDLRGLQQHTRVDELEAMALWIDQWQRMSELIEQFLRFPKPVIAAVDGRAWGGGFALALACDLVVASRSASFAVPAVRRGIIGGIVAPLLAFRLGSAVASRALLTGDPISSRMALRFGLVTNRPPSAQIWVAANDLAGRVASAPPIPLAATKRLLNETIGESLLTHLSVGAAAGATACSSETAAEGLTAFVEERDPKWPL
ncbi:MAG: enoyl-CoA hydratase/isomerase family protein [Planctomycetaceae bacterium]|nr:MAG: enoyl-CoA hydratase/isomerase family protein [Planctomycetaceae bacterium]